MVALVAALLQVGLRRLFKGRRRPSWSLMQEALTDVLRSNGRLLQSQAPADARRLSDRLQLVGASTKGVEVDLVSLADRTARKFRIPGRARGPARILYLHGGAYVFGSSDSYRGHLAAVAKATGCDVLAPDYRLAPEHPYPAALDDAEAFVQAALRISDEPWVVMGDSAGGALAVAACQRLAARDEPLPAGLVLLSPWMDLSACEGSVLDNQPFDWGDKRYLDNFAAQYLRDTDPTDPGASPVFGRMQGLPPTLLFFGGAELVRDQARAFADKAQAAGVQVTVSEDEDMVHGYWMMGPAFPADRVLGRVAGWIPGLRG